MVFYLNAGGQHLCRLIVDLESVPALRQVTDQVLYGRVLDLYGVEVDTAKTNCITIAVEPPLFPMKLPDTQHITHNTL